MTPLKPCESRQVRGVASRTYPVNEKCAHPECSEPATKHHCFPRSQINDDSYFVQIEGTYGGLSEPIPHVVGLCGSGTTGHHGAVEAHEAWIKLEDAGDGKNLIFNWYDRHEAEVPTTYDSGEGPDWKLVGPLNPQPGSREGKPKRKKHTGEARRKRRTISIKVPADTENGGEVWDETLDQVKAKLVTLGLYEEGADIPIYEALIAALRDWLDTVLFDGSSA